jgi:hypothetical protein
MDRPQTITLAELRSSGVRVLIYCADYQCSHWIRMNADQWPDDIRLSDLEDKFTCTACGKRGSDVRPDFDWQRPKPILKSSDEQKTPPPFGRGA